MADINDKITKIMDTVNPNVARLTADRAASGTTMHANNLTGWQEETPTHFIEYTLDSDSNPIEATRRDWKGIADKDTNTINNLTLLAGATDSGSLINNVIEAMPTAPYANDLADALLTSLNPDGSLKKPALESALQLKTSEVVANQVVPGTGLVTVTSGQTVATSSIAYYLGGIRRTKSGIANKTLTASKDTYCYIDTSETVTYIEVANNATAPVPPVNAILYAIVATDASSVIEIILCGRSPLHADKAGTLTADKGGNVSAVALSQVVDVYPNFYTRPAGSSTAGSSGVHSMSLPRAIAAGERVLLIPTSQTWCTANPNQPTSGSTFNVVWNCTFNTSQLSYSISAIYYIPKA